MDTIEQDASNVSPEQTEMFADIAKEYDTEGDEYDGEYDGVNDNDASNVDDESHDADAANGDDEETTSEE